MNEPQIKVSGRELAVSDAVRRRNPALFGGGGGSVCARPEPDQREQPPQKTLVRRVQKRPKIKVGVVVCVEIIALSNREPDSDNLIAGAKALRDAIAASLGVDDGDRRSRWSYGWCYTPGRRQVLVRISTI